ncbi:MAG: hypothetical protein NC453_24545 [Muribaculum sp.]|nr:hypothetical protein [Muribaculum sp.]
MKKLLYLSVILCTMSLCAQNISDGIWQADSPIVGDGYIERYEFTDSTFSYFRSQYLGVSKVVCLQGRYSIDEGSIMLQPESIIRIKPKSFDCDGRLNFWGGWETWNGWNGEYSETEKLKVKVPAVVLPFKYSIDSINIDGRMFYLDKPYREEY